MAIVLEHYAGALPPWLAPIQVRLIPIADRHLDHAAVAADALSAAGLRPEVDTSGGRMQAKVRDAQLAKVPYTLVVGDHDEQAGAVSVRLLDGSERRAVPLADFVQHLAATVGPRIPPVSRRAADPWGRDGPDRWPTGCRPGCPAAGTVRQARRTRTPSALPHPRS